jgi:hypothetical protein
MKKFDGLYPDREYVELRDIGTAVVKAERVYRCWHCRKETSWVDIHFLAPLCSEECCRAKWDEYFEATIKSNERYKNKEQENSEDENRF